MEKTEVELEDEKENSDASLESKVEKTSYIERMLILLVFTMQIMSPALLWR